MSTPKLLLLIKNNPLPFLLFFCQGFELKTSTTNINARGLGDPSLLQSYFVCVTESKSSTLIEYGKTLGTTQSGDVYLNMLDLDKPLNARFYAFGNGKKEADVIDAHIVARDQTKAECKGDTFMDLTSKLCTQHCHEDCDPLYGKPKHIPRFANLMRWCFGFWQIT